MTEKSYVIELVKWHHKYEELMVSLIEGKRIMTPGWMSYLRFNKFNDPVRLDYCGFADLDEGDLHDIYDLYGEALDLIDESKNISGDLLGNQKEVKNFYGGFCHLSNIFLTIAYTDGNRGYTLVKKKNKQLYDRVRHIKADAIRLNRKAGLIVSDKHPVRRIYVSKPSNRRRSATEPEIPEEYNQDDVERLVRMIRPDEK